jgi:hypothetical protein
MFVNIANQHANFYEDIVLRNFGSNMSERVFHVNARSKYGKQPWSKAATYRFQWQYMRLIVTCQYFNKKWKDFAKTETLFLLTIIFFTMIRRVVVNIS